MSPIFELDSKYQEVINDCDELANNVEPYSLEADESSVLYEPVLHALQDSGLSSLMVPQAYGGRFESVDPLACLLYTSPSPRDRG